MRQKPEGVVCLFLAFLLITDVANAADFLRSYKAGLDAVESENWPLAATLMRQAISGRSEESRRLPRYAYLKAYLPHFYLGLALFEQGDCSGAARAWAESERHGVVQDRPQYPQITLAREVCKTRSAPTPEPVPPSPTPAPETEKALSSIRSSSPPPPPSPAKPRSREPAPSPREPTPEVRSTPPPPRSHETYGGGFRRQPTPVGEPSVALLEAAEAYLAGSYQQVVDGLSQASTLDPYSQAQAHLLLAAAEFSLYLIGGEQDAEQLERARAAVLAMRRTLPDLEPPERYFSPRFLDFFYGQRLEGEHP